MCIIKLTEYEVIPLKETALKLYHRINDRWLDYRYKVPGNAGICFAYYLIMSIIPICSICAFLASIVDVDLSIIQDFLKNYLTPEFSSIIISALKSREITISSIIAIGISIFVVSRGINQLYGITKSLFPSEHNRNFIFEQAIIILKTVFVFILLILILSMLTFLPILNSVFNLNDLILFDDIYLFLVFFVILFLLYKILPDVHVHFMDIIYGTFTASSLMTVLLAILEFYFSFADYSTVYGSLASIVIMLFSFNFIAEVIYIGMYVMFETHMKRLIKKLKKQL